MTDVKVAETDDPYMFPYKGCNFPKNATSPEYLETLEDFEIRDSDVFLVTYPKSGTVWTQQILILMFANDNSGDYKSNFERMPWIEIQVPDLDVMNRPSPRLFSSHLPYYLAPKGLKEKKGKVIYVLRNPKDTMVSYFHFSKMMLTLKTENNIDDLLENYLSGDMVYGSWFEHVKGWFTHKDQLNCLFLSYEEMVKDLHSAVVKISKFMGKDLDDATIDMIVEKSTFKNMKNDPKANYEFFPDDVTDKKQGHFLRKGKVGDWKNTLTVAQNERFNEVFQAKMKNVPLEIIWEL
ncbi:amine sulfotransferase-like [Polypterus senegalus]|uniref:amine sulfotransferase-like n=1 Tax=Polypterus senegalus TaxID=55291 RepID=UPI0019639B00|nr:amine sulfotransferase-like [Polypterus senegalus]